MSALINTLMTRGIAVTFTGKAQHDALLALLFPLGAGFTGAHGLVQDPHFYPEAIGIHVGPSGSLHILLKDDINNHSETFTLSDLQPLDFRPWAEQIADRQANAARRREAKDLAYKINQRLNDAGVEVSENTLQMLRSAWSTLPGDVT